jgi:4-hydroxybenzoate polyprenyltransferase
MESLGGIYYFGLFIVALLFAKQQKEIVNRDKSACFKSFLANNYVGLIVFIALFLSYL